MMLVARFTLETATPLRCGGGEDPLQDRPVTRDAFGFWRIPGSSAAGALRAWVRESFGAARERSLFGMQERDEGRASLVWCEDAVLLDLDGAPAMEKALNGGEAAIPSGPFIRDHVRLSLKTGCAEEGGKFDGEIVPPGARFALELRLDPGGRAADPEDSRVFLEMCAALAAGGIRLGGGLADGCGRMRAVAAACRSFDMASPAGVEAWLNLPHSTGFPKDCGDDIPLPPAPPPPAGRGLHARLAIPLETRGPILVGGVNDADDADIACLLTPVLDYGGDGRKAGIRRVRTLPGSSFRGVLRHRVHRAARALGMDADADAVVRRLFGSVSGAEGAAGRVHVEDVLLEEAKPVLVQHVAIDRFAGGALDAALFDEAPVWEKGLAVPLRLELRGLDAAGARLLLHALLDLASERLPVGSGAGRGNGLLRLRGLDDGWKAALAGVEIDASWDGERLNTADPAMLERWLGRLEGEQS